MSKKSKDDSECLSLLDRIRKASTIKDSAVLSESKFFEAKDMVTTMVPALNIILSGEIDGGLTPGHTMFAGPSKHFKTLFMLILMKPYLDKYPEAVAILYDSEFGSPLAYFDSLGIDPSRVLHTPIIDFEQLKFDIMAQLQGIERGDKVFIGLDSIGMLASRKETEDAINEKSVADMTRAKAVKSLFRLVTPRLTIKDIPLVSVNHTYKTMELYSKDVVGGGTGSYYASDNIYIIGRQQDKEPGEELDGYFFVVNVEKSRFVREKAKVSINVTFEDGMNKWSGLLDLAVEGGFLTKEKKKSTVYTYKGSTVEYSEEETNREYFWKSILSDENFKEFVRKKYKLSAANLLGEKNVEVVE